MAGVDFAKQRSAVRHWCASPRADLATHPRGFAKLVCSFYRQLREK